jgi:hypothetical protein
MVEYLKFSVFSFFWRLLEKMSRVNRIIRYFILAYFSRMVNICHTYEKSRNISFVNFCYITKRRRVDIATQKCLSTYSQIFSWKVQLAYSFLSKDVEKRENNLNTQLLLLFFWVILISQMRWCLKLRKKRISSSFPTQK